MTDVSQDRYLDLSATTTRYRLDGPADAPTLVLVHEMGGAIESWDGVAAVLGKRWHVLRHDVRGAGMAERLRADVSVEELADDVALLLDRLDIRGPVGIAGGAVGAAIALCFAARHVDRTAAVAALSPALGVPAAVRAERHALADQALDRGMRGLEPLLLEGGYPEPLRRAAPQDWETFRTRWLGNDPVSFRFTYRMLIELDFEPFYGQVAAPALAVGATLDPLRPPAQAQALAGRLAHAEYGELATGHHAAVQSPAAVAAMLDRFFARQLLAKDAAA